MRLNRSCWMFGLAALVLTAQTAGAQVQAGETLKWPPLGVSYYGDTGSPDISGLWLGSAMAIPGGPPQTNAGQSSDGRPPAHWAPWPLPYTPEYQKIYEERVAATARGVALGDIGSRCLPVGLPRLLASKVYPDEIVQIPGAVVFFMYSSLPVVIWTDGRQHPADLKPTYAGHTIGHWVGDTLFADTVALMPNSPLDTMRNPHSGAIRLKWSVRRVAPDVLHVHLTVFDAEAFTEPVTMTNIWHRMSDPKWQVLDDGSCFENASGISQKPPEEGFIRF